MPGTNHKAPHSFLSSRAHLESNPANYSIGDTLVGGPESVQHITLYKKCQKWLLPILPQPHPAEREATLRGYDSLQQWGLWDSWLCDHWPYSESVRVAKVEVATPWKLTRFTNLGLPLCTLES